jgi:uncharacterized protein YyaL (SSP411 family)
MRMNGVRGIARPVWSIKWPREVRFSRNNPGTPAPDGTRHWWKGSRQKVAPPWHRLPCRLLIAFFLCQRILFAQSTTGTERIPRHRNRLADEASPYLRLHANDPVDWYPWGEEALEKARRENKPIFLSIGYSTCFWCHVMQREVFSKQQIADYLNAHFICIKVDREERPDLDDVYMLSLQIYLKLAGSSEGGGWPLSLFLTPEAKPIAGGTYFPPQDQPGRMGFPTVLRQIQNAWNTRQADLKNTADLVARDVARLSSPSPAVTIPTLDAKLIELSVSAVVQRYDQEFGGFDFDPAAPEGTKFPNPSRIQLIQAQVGRELSQSREDAAMVDKTLSAMAAGGIHDHLGGGFHRYSTDRRWQIPHFEKMLYDNAQLTEVYLDAYRRTGREQYLRIAEETLQFVHEELTSPQGGFYSALDAETDGIEGKYYVWEKPEIDKILSASDLRVFVATYGLDEPSPFEHGYVLRWPRPLNESAEQLGLPLAELQSRLRDIQGQLLAARRKRAPLLRDEKIITAWNGLMIRAYAKAGQILKRREYIDRAERAALLLLSAHRDTGGRLLRMSQPGHAVPAFLDDYAYLASGLLALYEATGEEKWLSSARRLTDDQMKYFWDQQRGGFYFTAKDQPVPMVRLKSAFDGEMPSGNSVSAQNLVKLARFKTDEIYRTAAQKTFLAFAPQLQQAPANLPCLALALQEYLHWYGGPSSGAAGDDLFAGSPSSPSSNPNLSPGSGSGTDSQIPQHRPGVSSADRQLRGVLEPSAEEARQHPDIHVRAYLSRDRFTPGDSCEIAIEIEVEQGWHLNANPPQPDFVIPVQVSLLETTPLRLEDVKYPAGAPLKVAGSEEPLSVYQGRVWITGRLVAGQNFSSARIPLELQVRYQLCDDQKCLQPKTLQLKSDVSIASVAQPSRPMNSDLFQRLKEFPQPVLDR